MELWLGLGAGKRVHQAMETSNPRETTMTRTRDQRIDALQPGQDLRLSGDDTIWVTVERSGDGQWLRFVRHTRNGFHVFQTVRS
jgi:hypothetical protein